MKIRTFEFSRDWMRVRDLWASAGTGVQLRRSDEPEEIKKKLLRDPELFLIAEQDGEIIGAVMGGYDGRRGLMYHLAVAHSHRRRGVGTRLQEELEARFRALGCLRYYLLVTDDNEDAMEFYKANGCTILPLTVMGKDVA